MSDPLDVIMPAYNAERWIRSAVASVRSIGPVRSLTIADDGSATPLTADNAGAEADPRVTVIRRTNGGEAAARNSAIEHLLAHSDPADDAASWVMFFDSDDILLDSCVAALADAEAADAGACVASREGFWADGTTRRFDPPQDLRDTTLHSPDDTFRYQHVFASTGMTVRRSILRAGTRWDEQIHTCPDIELLHRFAKQAPVWVSTRLMLRYRMHTDGENLSGIKHLPRRAHGFVRTVRLHATPANDHLFRTQAEWLTKELSKRSTDLSAFAAMRDLHRERGWPMRLKPQVRFTVRRGAASLLPGASSNV